MIFQVELLHCHIMREDRLFLQGEFLENIWLECIRGLHLLRHGCQLWRFRNTSMSARLLSWLLNEEVLLTSTIYLPYSQN